MEPMSPFDESTVSSKVTVSRSGKVKYGILAWLIGLPLPIIILALFFRGCDF